MSDRRPIVEPLCVRNQENQARQFAKEFVTLALCLGLVAAFFAVLEIINDGH